MGFADTIFNWLPKFRKPNNTLAEAQCDDNGNLKVALVSNVSAETTWVDPAPGTPLTHRRTVAATEKKLHQIFGVNEGASTRWFMVFDTNANPIASAEPVFSWPVEAGKAFCLELPRPRTFLTGITWAVSSTADDYTADTGATFRVNAEVQETG